MLSQAPRVLRKWSSSPEFNIALFALLLNLPWEFLQVHSSAKCRARSIGVESRRARKPPLAMPSSCCSPTGL